MIIISQDNNAMLLSQHIAGGEVNLNDSYDPNEGYDIFLFSLSGDMPNMGTYPTQEQAQQELKRLLERINRSTSNSATYQLPPAGYNTIP